MQFQPGEVVSLKGFVNARWLVLSKFFHYKEVDFYVQQEELGWAVLFDYLPPAQVQPPKKSRFRLFGSHHFCSHRGRASEKDLLTRMRNNVF